MDGKREVTGVLDVPVVGLCPDRYPGVTIIQEIRD